MRVGQENVVCEGRVATPSYSIQISRMMFSKPSILISTCVTTIPVVLVARFSSLPYILKIELILRVQQCFMICSLSRVDFSGGFWS